MCTHHCRYFCFWLSQICKLHHQSCAVWKKINMAAEDMDSMVRKFHLIFIRTCLSIKWLFVTFTSDWCRINWSLLISAFITKSTYYLDFTTDTQIGKECFCVGLSQLSQTPDVQALFEYNNCYPICVSSKGTECQCLLEFQFSPWTFILHTVWSVQNCIISKIPFRLIQNLHNLHQFCILRQFPCKF